MDRLAAFMWLVVAQGFRQDVRSYYLQYIISEQRYIMAYKRDLNKILGRQQD